MKIKLTEGQVQRLKHISEGLDDKYNTQVNVTFNTSKDFNFPYEINDINSTTTRVSFDIDVEYKSWGIKGIMLYNIQGPETIEAEIEYYGEDYGKNDYDDDLRTATIPVKLDWENALRVENESGTGLVTIDNEIEITLAGSSESGFYAREIQILTYTL